jgi:transposase-like protein
MKRYSAEERQVAIRLSNEIGTKAASARLGINYGTLSTWRSKEKNYGDPAYSEPRKRPESQARERTANEEISILIEEAVKQGLERDYSLFDTGDSTVTPAAMQATRNRLRAFPDVCLRAQGAEGTEAAVLAFEIRTIKDALTGISDDPYYQIVPDLYFHGLTNRQVSLLADCDMSSIWWNERRLLGELAFWIYGVAAWWRNPLIAPDTLLHSMLLEK